jgi:hypothetical protein
MEGRVCMDASERETHSHSVAKHVAIVTVNTYILQGLFIRAKNSLDFNAETLE